MDKHMKADLMVLIENSKTAKANDLCSESSKSSCEEDKMSKGNTPSPEIKSSFCSMSNLQSSVVYLSQELQNLGFRYKIIEANEEKLNLVALVNACWDTVQLYHAAIKDGNILHDSRRRDVADINHLQSSVRDLKSAIDEKDRLLLEAQEKERQLNSINKALASKLKSEKDEIRRLNSILQQRELQHQHENKKKEIEMNKLQDRLHRLVSGDRGMESRTSTMTMTGSLHRSDRARAKWRTDSTSIKHEEEIYRRAQSHLESWVEQLSQEVDLLKEFLSSITGKLSKLAVKCANSQVNCIAQEVDNLNDSLACSVLSSDSIEPDPLLSLSFLSVKEKIQKTLDDNLQIISLSLQNKENNNIRIKEDVIQNDDEVESKLENVNMDKSIERNMELLAEGLCVEKEEEIKVKEKQLVALRKKLQQEREVFAAAAVRLNKERASFEAEKVELLRYQFLEELPSSIMSNSGDPFTPNTSLESPLNQSLSDLYGDSPQNLNAVPHITSPTGNITHTIHPVTLGPTRLPRNHRESLYGTSRSRGGKSDPSTRNSSLSRSADMRYIHDNSTRAKTLERPTRATCPSPFITSKEESCEIPTRPSSQAGKRQSLSILPSNTSLSLSVNCPPVENKSSPRRASSPPGNGFRSTNPRDSHPISGAEESISCDSGFYYDTDDYENHSVGFHQTKDAQTNYRLNVLESSLMNLLNQINTKDRMASTCPSVIHSSNPYGDLNDETYSEGGSEAERPLSPNRRASYAIMSERGVRNRDESHIPRPRFSASGPVQAKLFDPEVSSDTRRMSTRQESAPGSLSSSRKSSGDRRSGEYYLKKIQNNFSRWYWK